MNENDGFDEKTMTWTLIIETDDDEVEIELPARFDVCDVCDGKGKRVNPAIDGHGISAEEFDDDPDFKEAYFSGAYDITCDACSGKRVIPVIVDDNLDERQREALRQHENRSREMHEIDEIQRMERMMGA